MLKIITFDMWTGPGHLAHRQAFVELLDAIDVMSSKALLKDRMAEIQLQVKRAVVGFMLVAPVQAWRITLHYLLHWIEDLQHLGA